MSRTDLTLYEQLVLLALESTGAEYPVTIKKKYLEIGVAGAILFLLVRSGRVTFQRGGYQVRGQLSVGDAEVDDFLKGLENKADPFKPLRIGRWLQRAAKPKLKNAVVSGLVNQKILATKKSKLFIRSPEAREEIVQRLSAAIREKERADEQTAALASLAHATMCLDKLEFSEELKNCKKQLNALAEQSGPVIPAVRTAVAERKLVNSIINGAALVAGSSAAVLLARACSS
ncbi:MAG: GPP34 family phosphoprotein [Gammaproteobacteria bacterium]|nr:GPP34 family phosphoprotein [Gammaproteobacteria bacterium]MDE0245070.1 GPP34 family phosphoprotein [Gammaproteobacteria bacterium]MDE0414851.1 GPP34 family phosphoprotein [Gammaproteobacteria bacterium]